MPAETREDATRPVAGTEVALRELRTKIKVAPVETGHFQLLFSQV
jgi:hypothetical protein